MATFVSVGNRFINVDNVCEVTRNDDGSVWLYFNVVATGALETGNPLGPIDTTLKGNEAKQFLEWLRRNSTT